VISSDQAERQVLAACLLSESAVADCTERLEPKHFDRPTHRRIFEAIVAVDRSGHPVETVSVADWLERSPNGLSPELLDYLNDLGSEYVAAATYRQDARVVLNHAIDRRLHRIGQAISEVAMEKHPPNERDSRIDKLVAAVYETQATEQAPSLEDAVTTTMERLQRAASGEAFGISTGYGDLDEILAGMQKGQLIIVAARPGMGKSALIMNVAQNTATGT